jgi:hypothetical protein
MSDDKELEELLKIAQSPGEAQVKPLREVEEFILFLGMEEGKEVVDARAIVDMYRRWSVKQENAKSFMRKFNKYFNPYKKAKYTYYLMNQKTYEMQFKITKMKEQHEKK